MQACCCHFPPCSTFSRNSSKNATSLARLLARSLGGASERASDLLMKNSTISPLVSFVTSRGTLVWKPSSHATPVFVLYMFDTFSNPHSFSLGSASSDFFNSSFFHCLSTKFCTSSSHCQCFAHSFLFASPRSHNLASFSSVFRICAPPLHAVGFVILCKSPALPSALLIICATFLYDRGVFCILLNASCRNMAHQSHEAQRWCTRQQMCVHRLCL